MLEEKKSTAVTNKMWFILILFGIFGQIAWSVENMYFNVFVYETIAPQTSAVTLMVQASGIIATVTTLFAGALSDKLGNRRHFISIGYIIWGIITLSFAFITKDNTAAIFGISDPEKIITTTILVVVFMDCVMTFFGSASNDGAFNAWVTDNTDLTNRGKVEGVLSALPLLALLIVAGGFGLIKDAIGYAGIFIILGSLVSIAGIVGLLTIKDAPLLVRDVEGNYFKDIVYGFRPSVIKKNKMLYIVLIAMCLFSISSQIYMPYLIIYMTQYLKFSTIEYSVILGSVVLIAAVSAALLGRLADKIGKSKLLFIGTGIYLAGLFALFFIRATMPKSTLLVLMGGLGLIMIIGSILLTILLNAMIRDNTPQDKAGKFQGIRMIFFVLIPMFIGPAIGDAFNQRAAVMDPATYTYYDPVAQVTANVPTPVLFLVAASIAVLVIIPLLYITNKLKNPDIGGDGDKPNKLLTEWGENIDIDNILKDYPRPQLERNSYINLNGVWQYAIINKDSVLDNYQGEILVPFAPECILSGVEREVMPDDVLYY
ncbi:MAG: MFS transporter, partial [Clostridia bacterium]|nr:MFS transporter [Clostridia bacterium]